MRITVSLLVNLVANGLTVSEILSEYPDLEAEDFQQALAYAAALTNDEFHPFAPTTASDMGLSMTTAKWKITATE